MEDGQRKEGGAWSEDGGRLETGGAAMIPCFRCLQKITHAVCNELSENTSLRLKIRMETLLYD